MTATKVRTIYLLMYMGFAFWRVYYNIYLEEIGLRGTQIGTLNAIMQSSIFFVVAYWGMIADKKGIRPTLRWLVVASAVCVFFLGNVKVFWILLFYIPFLTLFYHPLGPLTDALAVQYAETDEKHSYGSLRLWGSLGWALASVIGGVVFSKLSLKYVFPVSAVFFVVLIFFLSTRRRKRIYTPNFQSMSLREIIRNKPLLYFIGIMALYGITCSPVNSYLNLYFTGLGAGNNIVGYAYAIMAFSEVPLFLLGNKLLQRWGPQKIILAGMFVMLLRFAFYGLTPNIYSSLAVGALQGISLSFFLIGSVEYLQRLMANGRHATAQSFIWGAYVGIGQTTGNLGIGALLDKTGMVIIMQLFMLVAAICFFVTWRYFKKYSGDFQVEKAPASK